jgi:hypothetical protein
MNSRQNEGNSQGQPQRAKPAKSTKPEQRQQQTCYTAKPKQDLLRVKVRLRLLEEVNERVMEA